MEKIKINEIGIKFKDLPEKTPAKLRYNRDTMNFILEIKNQESIMLCCDKCTGIKFVLEGDLTRCINCRNLFLVGFAQ